MPRFPRLQATVVLFLLWVSACHRRQVAVPVPPPPVANQPAPQAPAPAAATSGTPSSGTTTPAPPVPAARKPARSAASSPASPPPQPPQAPAGLAPKLGDILTVDEQKKYNASVDQSLSHAQTSLNSIGRRQLNKDQQAQVEQIRNFMQQAQATRASDLAGAKSLAERAEVLAKDLAANLR